MHSECPPRISSPPLAPRRAAPPPPPLAASASDPSLPPPAALRPLTDAEVVAAERLRWDRFVQEGWFHQGLLHQRWDTEARRRGAAYRTRAIAARTRVRQTNTAALVLCVNLSPTLCTEEADAVPTNTTSSTSTSVGTVGSVFMWRSPALLPGDALSIVGELGRQLEQQYRSLSKRSLSTRHCHNPRSEDLLRALAHSRQHAGTENKVVLHYSGYGVPRPRGGSLYILSPTGEPGKVSLDMLRRGAGFPLVFIADCANAGGILHYFLKTRQKQEDEDNPHFTYRHFNTAMSTSTVGEANAVTGNWLRAGAGPAADRRNVAAPSLATTGVGVMSGGASMPNNATRGTRGGGGGVPATGTCMPASSAMPVQDDFFFIGATGEDGALPQHPWLPSDILTSCLTTPVRMALLWFTIESAETTSIHPLLLHLFTGALDDKKSPLGQLQWAFTSITECIAWSTLPHPLFVHLFREDVVVAPLFRGFLLAERIITTLGGSVSVYPPLPRTCDHPMWDTFDNILDRSLSALQRAAQPAPPAVLTSLEFREWLDWSVATWRCTQRAAQFSTLNDRSVPMPDFLEEELRCVAVFVEGVTEQGFVRLTTGPKNLIASAELLGYFSAGVGAGTGTSTATATHGGIARHTNIRGMGSYSSGSSSNNNSNNNKSNMNNCNQNVICVDEGDSAMHWEAPAAFPFLTRLPMLLQGLLVVAHRDRATELVCRLIDVGPPAVSACAEVDLFGAALVHYWTRSDLHHLLPALLFIYAKACYTDPELVGTTPAQRCVIVDAALGVLSRPVDVPIGARNKSAISSPSTQGAADTDGAPAPPLPGAWQWGTLGPYARAVGQRLLAAALLAMLCVHAESTRRRCREANALQLCCDLLAEAAARAPVLCPHRANSHRNIRKEKNANEEGENIEEEEEEEDEEEEEKEEKEEEDDSREERGGDGGRDEEEVATRKKDKARDKVGNILWRDSGNNYNNNNDDDDPSEDRGCGCGNVNGSRDDGPATTYVLSLISLLVTLTWDGGLPGRQPADVPVGQTQTQGNDKDHNSNVENTAPSRKREEDAVSLSRAIFALRRLRHCTASAVRGAALRALGVLLVAPSTDIAMAMRCVRVITTRQRKPYEGHQDNRFEHIDASLLAMRWLIDQLSSSMSVEEIRHAVQRESKSMHDDTRAPQEEPTQQHSQQELSRQHSHEAGEREGGRGGEGEEETHPSHVLDRTPPGACVRPPSVLDRRPKRMIRLLASSVSCMLAAAQGACPHVAARAQKVLMDDLSLLHVHSFPPPPGPFPCASPAHGPAVSSASRFTNFFTGFLHTFTSLGGAGGAAGNGPAVARRKSQGRSSAGASNSSIADRQGTRERSRSDALPTTGRVNCALRCASVHDGSAIVSFVFTLLSFLGDLMLVPLDDYDPRHPFNLERNALLRRYLRRMREALRHTSAAVPRDSEAQDCSGSPLPPRAMSMRSSSSTLHMPLDEEGPNTTSMITTNTTNSVSNTHTNTNANNTSHANNNNSNNNSNNNGSNNPFPQLHGSHILSPLSNAYTHGNSTRTAGRASPPLSSPLGAPTSPGWTLDGFPNSFGGAADELDAPFQLLSDCDTDAERGGRVQVLAFHPTERHFVTGTDRGVVQVWSLETGCFGRPTPPPPLPLSSSSSSAKAPSTAAAPMCRILAQFNVGGVVARSASMLSPGAGMRYMYAQRPATVDSDMDSDGNSDNDNDDNNLNNNTDKKKNRNNNNLNKNNNRSNHNPMSSIRRHHTVGEGCAVHVCDTSRSADEDPPRGPLSLSFSRTWQQTTMIGPGARPGTGVWAATATAAAAALLSKPHCLPCRSGEPLTGLHLVDPAYRTLLCAVCRSGAVELFAAYTDATLVRRVTTFDTMTPEDALISHQCLSSYHAPAMLLHVSGADGSVASWDLHCEHRASAGVGRGELPAAPSVLASHPAEAFTMAVGAGPVFLYDLRSPRHAMHVLPETSALSASTARRGTDTDIKGGGGGGLGTGRPLCLHISFSCRYAHGIVTGYGGGGGGAQGVVLLWDDRCLRQPLRHAVVPASSSFSSSSSSSSLHPVSHLDVQCYSSGMTAMAVTGDGLFVGGAMAAAGRGHFRLRHQSSAAAMHPVAPVCGVVSGGRLLLFGRRRAAVMDRRAY